MTPLQRSGLAIAAAGGLIAVVGLLVASGALKWFGRLPGDIRIERDHVRIYIPLASMLLLSLAASLLLHLLRRFW
ncbi:MAG: DUF2905 domain-containing protein [Acidobacteriota bacterium]